MGQVVESIGPHWMDVSRGSRSIRQTGYLPRHEGRSRSVKKLATVETILNTQQNARGLVEYWRDPIVSCFMNHQLAPCPRHAHGHMAEAGVLWLSYGMPRQNAAQ